MTMTLIEMDGFLRGKCIPLDMKVNETNAEYLLRKMNELQQKLTESERYGRQADITIENLERKMEKLAAENAALKAAAEFATAPDMWVEQADGMLDYRYVEWYVDVLKAAMETPTTDSILAEVREQGASLVISYHNERADALRDVDRDGAFRHESAALDAIEVLMKIREGAAK
ncbi:hypothetical protein QQF21_17680 [Lelliottia sp. V89_10]|uniref:hypothetical protein n=1 Tax=Lelliottia wanjuensis TaxID=3050585 RepID=UPI00249F561E|nr:MULTISPECIES: hypothetical protein [unclassified Lelliottia]MDI3361177.1 hypothetical protein [Lelliottia sp. V89_13]MDK9551276.1 hypothetical protein [Lelliottia sp. V89_5]MDK9597452.1 hypothetical protein [Lelliottia sp. V89_10]